MALPVRPILSAPREPLPPPLLDALRGTRPWITFFAVLGLIVSCLAGFGGVRAVLFSAGFWPRAQGVGMVLTSIVYFLPASYLLLYRGAIQRTLIGGGIPTLTMALKYQKSFWRTSGIITLLMFALYLVVVVIAYIAVAVMALRAG